MHRLTHRRMVHSCAVKTAWISMGVVMLSLPGCTHRSADQLGARISTTSTTVTIRPEQQPSTSVATTATTSRRRVVAVRPTPPRDSQPTGWIALPTGDGVKLVHPDGTGERSVPLSVGGPVVLAPNSKLLAVVATDHSLVVTDIRGEFITEVATADERVVDPAWSRDSTRLAFTIASSPPTLVVHDISTGSRKTVFTAGWTPVQGFQPAFSPDGTRLVVAADSPEDGDNRPTLGIVDLATNAMTTLDHRSEPDDYQPDWSPDGSRILYLHRERYILNAVAGSLVVIDVNAQGTLHAVPVDGPSNGGRWSPDGRWIVYTFDYIYREFVGRTEVRVASTANGQTFHEFDIGANPSWGSG